jgi:hypothetical protein
MQDQVSREVRLAANWRQWYGASVTAVMWGQELRRMEQEVTTEGLAAVLLTQEELGNPEMVAAGVDAAREMVLDPSREEQALRTLMGLSPILKRTAAKRALDELRTDGKTVIDVPEVFGAEPRLQALIPMVDVFFPAVTDDIQRAPWVAHREELSPEELRDRVNTHGYDEEWVERAIEHKGTRFGDAEGLSFKAWYRSGNDAKRDVVEIFHEYRRELVDGIPQVMCRVMSVGCGEDAGYEGRLPFLHGKYPYVVHRREYLTRAIIESRGISELGESWQQEQKTQRDARTDRTSVATLPPLITPARRGAGRLRLGPGVQVPAAGRNENYEWMRTPPYDPGSLEIEKALDRGVARYFGRLDNEVHPQLTLMHQEDLVSTWLIEVRQVCEQVLQLCQQYMTDEQVARIVGTLGRSWQMGAADIQGQFDLSIEMDPRDLNMEILKEKWGFIEILLKYDRSGRVDFSKLVEVGMAGVDPTMAEMVLIPADAANKRQVDEELDALNKMLVGIEPDMNPQPGMNYQLRAQVLQGAIARNPEMQRRIAGQPDTAALVENRMKFLQFQVQQIENAQIGRVGTGEVLQ